jgi:hypothetical protein
MIKVWFVLINGKQEGPFAIEDLKGDHRLTPDTLVWKEGFETWVKIREVEELKELFEDHSETHSTDENDLKDLEKADQNELVLDMQTGIEPPYFFWILLALISLIYVMLQLYYR